MNTRKALTAVYNGGEDINCTSSGRGQASILSQKYEPSQDTHQAHYTILYAVSIYLSPHFPYFLREVCIVSLTFLFGFKQYLTQYSRWVFNLQFSAF